MPTRLMPPDSPHRPATDAGGSPASSVRRGPTPRPIRPASKLRLCSRRGSVPSCLQQGGVSGLSPVSPRQTRESPFFGRFDRLAVYDRNARLRFPIGSEANLPAQAIVDSIEGPIESPAPVTSVDRRVVRKIPGQIAPLAPSAHQIKNCIDDFTTVEFRRTTCRLPGKQRSDLGPLIIGQVRRISASHDGCMLEGKAPD